MDISDEILDVLGDSEQERIDSLYRLEDGKLSRSEWTTVERYLDDALSPDADVAVRERLAAIDVSAHLSFPDVWSRLDGLAHEDTDDAVRAHAAKTLARMGGNAADVIVDLLDDPLPDSARTELAECLLLVASPPSQDDLTRILWLEHDTEVRFWVAGALADLGDADALDRELQAGHSAAELTNLVERRWDAAGRPRHRVRPRITRISAAQPAAVGDDPAPSLEVRGGGGGGSSEPPPPGPLGGESSPSGDERQDRPRVFEASVPSRVRLDTVVGITYRMALSPSGSSVHEVVDLHVPTAGLDLRVMIRCPGFELQGSNLRTLHVPADEDSGTQLVELRALQEGVHVLMLSAFHPEGSLVAELAVEITVDAVAPTTETKQVVGPVSPLRARPGEVALLIDRLANDAYSFQFVGQAVPPEVVGDPLQVPARRLVEPLISRLGELARGAGAAATRSELRQEGTEMWLRLVPEALRDQFWQLRERISSLRIIARNDPIPWELLYPLDRDHDEGFLVEQFPVLRWVRGVHPPAPVGSGPVVTVLPGPGAPTSAATEVETVRSMWQTRDGGAPIEALQPLRDPLERADFGVLHFACHNTFRADTGSAIRFGADSFVPSSLAPAEAMRALEDAAPLVVMNACRSAGQSPSYTELVGWATRFIDAGASAFIGSLWDVRDTSAKRFIETFYGAVLDGRTLGEAVVQARAQLDEPDDPTWLAYTVYGDAAATITGGQT